MCRGWKEEANIREIGMKTTEGIKDIAKKRRHQLDKRIGLADELRGDMTEQREMDAKEGGRC